MTASHVASHAWLCLFLMWSMADTHKKNPDVQVTCMFSEDCVLPCLFEPVGDEVIQWYRQNVLIYSYKQGSDMLNEQKLHNSGRISLFADMISSGNASLHLWKCGPQDRGRYRCLVTSSEEKTEHFIIVKVEAPIRSVSLETTRLSGFEEVICSTRDVYPAPRITLFTEPDISLDTPQPSTRKTADNQGLYSVESRLEKIEDPAQLTYICLVQSFYRSQTWRTSLQEREIYSIEGQDLIIPCVSPWYLQNFTLKWSFTRGHEPSSTIYTYDSLAQQSSGVWEGRVRLASQKALGGDGSLQLQSPLKLEHTGTFTCILSAFQIKHEIRTGVNVISKAAGRQPESSPQWWIPATVISGLLIIPVAAGIIIGIRKLKASCSRAKKTQTEFTEMQPIRVTVTDNEGPSESSCLTEEHRGANTHI